MSINTAFLLIAQYNGKAIIPLEDVRRDYFSHLTTDKFARKVASGAIELPVVRMEKRRVPAASTCKTLRLISTSAVRKH